MMAAMMNAAATAARREQERAIDRLAEQLTEEAPGASIETEEGRIVLAGKRLVQKWISSAGLRFASEALK